MEVYERFVKACEEGKLETARDMYEKYGDIIKKESDFMSGKIFLDIYKQKEDNLPKWLYSVLKSRWLITPCLLYEALDDAILFGDLASVYWFYSEICEMCEFRGERFEYAYRSACSRMHLHIVNYFRFVLSKYIMFAEIEKNVFYEALADGNVPLFDFILAINPNISIKHKECFLTACTKGYLEIAKRLYTKVEPYILDIGFDYACAQGKLDLAQWLLYIIKETKKPNVLYTLETKYGINRLFLKVCQYGHIEVAQWLYSVFDNIDLLHEKGVAFQTSCWKADVSQSHLELAQWLEQLNPYLFEIIYDEQGMISDHKIHLDREKRWQERKYALWLSSNETPKKDNLLYRIPEDVSRYLISNYL